VGRKGCDGHLEIAVSKKVIKRRMVRSRCEKGTYQCQCLIPNPKCNGAAQYERSCEFQNWLELVRRF
jgi:hypothetical protein